MYCLHSCRLYTPFYYGAQKDTIGFAAVLYFLPGKKEIWCVCSGNLLGNPLTLMLKLNKTPQNAYCRLL